MEVLPQDQFSRQPSQETSRGLRRFIRSPILPGWPSPVQHAVMSQYWNITVTSIMLGPLFDAYLLIRGGSNSFVGVVESARGIAALTLAWPIGWAGDHFPKPVVLRFNLCFGLIAVLLLLVGIPLDLMPLIIPGAVMYAVHNQCLFALIPPLLADLIETGNRRTRVLSHLQSATSLGNASGPLIQMFLIALLHADVWTAAELHGVLCLGGLFFLMYAPHQLQMQKIAGATLMIEEAKALSASGPSSSASSDADGRDGAQPRPSGLASSETAVTIERTNNFRDVHADLLKPWQRWLAAGLIEISNVTTAIGSGMTFKYWPLFFKGDFGFSPAGVCAMQLSIWMAIAGSAQLASNLAKHGGRLFVALSMHVLGTGLLFLISNQALGAGAEVVLVLVRNAAMNAGGPLLTALILELVPKHHRGKWSSLTSLRRVTWSGSAFVGGLLSDKEDYRYAFFITACVHSFAGLVLFFVCLFGWRAGRNKCTSQSTDAMVA